MHVLPNQTISGKSNLQAGRDIHLLKERKLSLIKALIYISVIQGICVFILLSMYIKRTSEIHEILRQLQTIILKL